jgi:flagellar basal body P-ring formation protein FlgA
MKTLSRKIYKNYALLFTLLMAASVGVARGQALVTVASESVARNERVTLGDIAEIQSADDVTIKRLGTVALGYAPNVGATRELAKEKIATAIAAAGFSAEAVRLQSPAIAIIKRAGQRVSAELLRSSVENAALGQLRGTGTTAELIRLDLPQNIELPSGEVEARASVPAVRDYAAPFPVSIELLVDGRVVRRLSVTAQIEAKAPVLVAAHDLAARTRLGEESVRVRMRKLDRPPQFYLGDTERLRGAAITRAVKSGEPITTDMFYADMVIRPGDTVSIICESGSLTVKVEGEARASGRVGDHIQVKNLQSGALLQATVVDEGLVRVRF